MWEMRRDIVKQFRIHNTKGVVISLVLPVDRKVKLIWQSLANDARLGRKVVSDHTRPE